MNDQPLNFCAFVMDTPSHIIHGLWRDPEGEQLRFNELELWIDLAQRLEAGGFDAVFFADVIGLYHDFRGGPDFHEELGLQIPSNDPMVIISALAAATENLGLAFTLGWGQVPPFQFARQVSTPDHASGVHADPSKIHPINHVGEHFKVEGPFLVTPSPQRTPLLFQAGSSPVGRDFCARHAEAQFIQSPSPEDARKQISETRDLLERNGRTREEIKFFQGLSFVVGATEEEALRKERELDEKIDDDGMVAHMGGAIGVDLGGLDIDDPLDAQSTEGVQGILNWLKESAGGG